MSTANTTPIAADRAAAGDRTQAVLARLGDYLELTKPRIVVLELCVAAATAYVAAPHALAMGTLFAALAATALVAASASIANQWLEREVDGSMRRTAGRPLVVGRVTSAEAIALSAVSLAAGTAWLAARVNWQTAALGAACWVVYVLIYTPLKTRSTLNTAVGAVAGAIPVLMGWAATGRPLDLTAWAIAGVLFLWQFPHFMAIAWLYRRDYAAAGHQMLSVVDPTGARAGVQAVIAALILIPVSLIPALSPTSGSPLVYSFWALGLGGAQLALAVKFALNPDELSARKLLRGTLVYLPTWLALLLMVAA